MTTGSVCGSRGCVTEIMTVVITVTRIDATTAVSIAAPHYLRARIKGRGGAQRGMCPPLGKA